MNRRISSFLLLSILFVLLVPLTLAYTRSGHLTLLTVAETDDPLDEPIGGTADVYLEIRPGSGKIFIDSYPLTKLDTQSSTRFANRVACSFLREDCSRYDFFYTIRADSPVVGGPSAGGAIAVLTAAMLSDTKIDESIAMTGTINSGGIIGPVAGLRQKTDAANEKGLKLVLVSAFSYPTELNRTYLLELNATKEEDRNLSLNLSRLYAPLNLSQMNIPVKEVATLEEALDLFAGREPPTASATVVEDADYTALMQDVAGQLCDRRDGLSRSLVRTGANLSDNNFTERREDATGKEDWYSLASYCFSDLIRLRTTSYENVSQLQRSAIRANLLGELETFDNNLAARNFTTMAELETYLIVQERVAEARDILLEENASNITAAGLAYAVERHNSANAWSAFFQLKSEPLPFDEESLANACAEKLSEAQERISYTALYLPDEYLTTARDEAGDATSDQAEERYARCLFHASKAVALADLYAGTMSVPEEKVQELLDKKLDAVASVIVRQQERGLFPIMGYSYYQYSRSLADHDPFSALTFAEYSLELSNLDMYFPPKRQSVLPAVDWRIALLFASGVLLGIVLGTLLGLQLRSRTKKEKRPEKRKRR